jgi:hypothetical protein
LLDYLGELRNLRKLACSLDDTHVVIGRSSLLALDLLNSCEQVLKASGQESPLSIAILALNCVGLARASLAVSENGSVVAQQTRLNYRLAHLVEDLLLVHILCSNVVEGVLVTTGCGIGIVVLRFVGSQEQLRLRVDV